MNLLLDSHVLLWWFAGEGFSAEAGAAIADPDNLVAVSAASIWEIEIKHGLGKLDVPGDVSAEVERGGFEPLPISFHHARRAAHLPMHHRDPFDRMLIAQATTEGLTIVTRDQSFSAYDVPLLLA